MIALLLVSLPTVPTLSVEGAGYLRFLREGRVVYARSAAIMVVQGRLAHRSGARLMPEIMVGEGATWEITADGTIRVGGRNAGRIVLALFAGAEPTIGPDGLGTATDRAALAAPGTQDAGTLKWIRPAAPAPAPAASPAPSQQSLPTPSKVVASEIAAPSRTRLEVRAEIEINAEQIKIGDLVTNAPAAWADLVVDPAPPLGMTRKIDRIRIESRLRRTGVDPRTAIEWAGSTEISIRRASQTISAEQIEQFALQTLNDRFATTLRFNSLQNTPQPMTVPPGTVDMIPGEARASGNTMSLPIEIRVNGVRHNSRTLNFRTESLIKLPTVGSTVSVFSKIGGIRIENTGRVVRVEPGTLRVEVILNGSDERVAGILVRENTIEVKG